MKNFEGISFWWALFLMAGLALIFGVRAFLSHRQVIQDAKADYDYKRANGMLPDALGRETYERIYRRVYGPRGPAHVAIAMAAIVVATPLAMILFEFLFNLIYNLSGQNRVIEPGFLVWQFFLFFGMIGIWVWIGYLAARRYHQTAPGSLQFEIDQHLYGGEDFGESFN